jgi:succinate dehydrogenase/fumarate reductase flavoprotein subunit
MIRILAEENTMANRFNPGRRKFIKEGAIFGVGATALTAPPQNRTRWDHTADVVVVGAGASGLPAAIMARDRRATVIVIDVNHDIGGHAMLSGGRVPLGGGTSVQKYGIEDSADQVYRDHTDHRRSSYKFSDRSLVRVWADENVATFEFLVENGVKFVDAKPTVTDGTVPRLVIAQVYSPDLKETINARPGSGIVRALEKSARAKGVQFLLKHRLAKIVRENATSGKVLGITARLDNKDVNIQARRGVIIATGGHTGNVEFRRMFDPRLTEEYQVAGEPWTKQNADGELLAMEIGAHCQPEQRRRRGYHEDAAYRDPVRLR